MAHSTASPRDIDEPTSGVRLVEQVEERWATFRAAFDRLPPASLESLTSSGWSAKEMLGHIAFWYEAIVGYLTLVIRNEALPPAWAFGSGYTPTGDGWPEEDFHNAREAAWARQQTASLVLQRVAQSHAALPRFLITITPEQRAQQPEYFDDLGNHYTDHLPDLLELGGT